MPPSHLPEDRTGPPDKDPVTDPTTSQPPGLARAQAALYEIYNLQAKIRNLPDAHPAVRQRAATITDDVDMLTDFGRRLNMRYLPELERLRDELAELITGHTMIGITARRVTPLNTGARNGDDTDVYRLDQLIRAARADLPKKVSRWPWRDRAAKHRIKAWHRAYKLIQDPTTPPDRVDWAAVKTAWRHYCALLHPQPTQQPAATLQPRRRQIEAAPTYATPEGA